VRILSKGKNEARKGPGILDSPRLYRIRIKVKIELKMTSTITAYTGERARAVKTSGHAIMSEKSRKVWYVQLKMGTAWSFLYNSIHCGVY
jgi:hypothetical protein